MASEIQPYVGPRPFERNDQSHFFGREGEASELSSYVIAHPVVLLYSQSGAGKTSLVNARLIPFLEKEGFEILPLARVRGLMQQEIRSEEISNIYVFNVLTSWAEGQIEPNALAKMSLKEFLQQRFHSAGEEEPHTPFVAIFDQFEELFTFYPERWGDRQDFFDQVSDALDEERLMRVVFAMREDFIAELDPYVSVMPEKLRTRFRMERLHEEDALAAVTGPLEGTGYSFAEGVAEQLVRNLLKVPVEISTGVVNTIAGEFAEPVQLQVVCQTLWQKLQLTGEKIITEDALKAFGDVDLALSHFYETAIAKVSPKTGVSEGRLRDWFERTLITPSGTRGTVFGGAEEVGGIPVSAVKELVNGHLLRAERRGGARWYELTHDRFIEPIRASNRQWLLQRSGTEQVRQWLEARALEWVRSNRDESKLLNEGELSEAQRWLDSPAAADIGYSDKLLALVQSSRALVEEAARERDRLLFEERQRRAEAEREREEEQRRRIAAAKGAGRLRRLAAALAVMFLLAVGAAVYAVNQTRLARQKEQVANDALSKAREAEERANKQTIIAEDQTRKTEESRKDAVEQQRLAIASAVKAETARKEAEKQARLAAISERNAKEKAVEIVRLKELEFKRKETEAQLKEMQAERSRAEELARTAQALDKSGNLAEALKYYGEASALYLKTKDDAGQVSTMRRMAMIYGIRNEYEKAEEEYKQLIEKQARSRTQDQAESALILSEWATLYQQQGKDDEAVQRYEQARKIKENLKLDNPDLDQIYLKLAKLYLKQEKYAEAELLYRQVVANVQKEREGYYARTDVEDDDPSVAWILTDLARIHWKLHHYDAAASFYNRMLKISRNIYDKAENTKEFAANVAESLDNLAELYKDWQKYDEADQYLREAHEIIVKAFGPKHHRVFSSLSEYGLFYFQQNKYLEAGEKYRQAREMIDERLKKQDPRGVMTMLENYSALLRKTNQEKEAAETDALAQQVRTEYLKERTKN